MIIKGHIRTFPVRFERSREPSGTARGVLDFARTERRGWWAKAAGLALLLPTPALAHPGHDGSGMAAGLLHPLTGADHLAAMLMVGLWAGLVAGRALWVLPASFLTAMLGGFAYGALVQNGGWGVEMAIILSLVVLGTALVLKLRAPLALAGGMVALFGFAHGMAHGLESPGGGSAAGFAGGFLIATALLHGAGLLLARVMPARWARAIGLAGAGFGLLLVGAS